jgi:hypothetical protein
MPEEVLVVYCGNPSGGKSWVQARFMEVVALSRTHIEIKYELVVDECTETAFQSLKLPEIKELVPQDNKPWYSKHNKGRYSK